MGAHGDIILLSAQYSHDKSFACTTQEVLLISQLHLLLGRQSMLCWEGERKLETNAPSHRDEGGRESINASMNATH